MFRDKRATYRVPVEDGDRLDICYTDSNCRSYMGRAIDVSIQGIGVTFDGDSVPRIPVSESVTVTLGSPHLSEPVDVAVEVCTRSDEDGVRRYGFSFLDPDRLKQDLGPELLELFNQRAAIRVQPSLKKPVTVDVEASTAEQAEYNLVLKSDPDVGEAFFPGELVDISTRGMRVSLDPASEKALAHNERVLISFSLPPSPKVLELEAWIRRRQFENDTLYYGLEFLTSENPHVVDFVARMQRVQRQQQNRDAHSRDKQTI